MLKIRLRRIGAIRQPHYRIVVADARSPRDGRFLEILGHYNPRTEPATIQVDVTKYEEWKRKGAQPTDAVERLVRQFNRAATPTEEAPAPNRRTRSASGKRVAGAAAAAPASEAVAEAASDEGEGSEAVTADTTAETGAEENSVEPVLEAAETPEGAAEGEADTDAAT
jgi:small subunit ribosomal protein S16